MIIQSKKYPIDMKKINKIIPFYHLMLYDESKIKIKDIIINDKKIEYHPVLFEQRVLSNSYMYLKTKEKKYIDTAKKFFDKLFNGSITDENGNIIFPYNFSFNLFHRKLEAPWFSGMAQGQALSALTAMYLIENDQTLIRLAEKIIPTLTYFKNKNTPWFAMID